MSPVEAGSSDTNMASGGSADPGHPHIHKVTDMALGSSGPDATMALGISVGHPYLCIEF